MTERVSARQKFRTAVYRIPVVGDLAYYLVCAFMRLTVSPVMRLSGYSPLKCGNCTIWSPKGRVQSILEGVEYLKKHDEQMFSRLTNGRRLIFYYSDNAWQPALNLFPLHETFIKWGAEGIAAFFVQSLLMHAASQSDNPYRINDEKRATVRAVPQKVLEWMLKHSVRGDFIDAYREVAR